MKRINFVFGLHNHQPIGNFDFVFEHAYEHSYAPFIEVLLKFPHVKANIHFTGILLEWILNNHPELIKKIKTLCSRDQIEILTGGYYEPIMPLISHEDRVGQITKLTEFIKKHLDYTPTGMWLAERVWEQGIVKSLVESGIKYVVLDDSHFINIGIEKHRLNSYFVTEDQGYKLKLVPIDKKSRYLIPFEPHDEVIQYFLEQADESGTKFLTMADDGEKFGDWPGTYESVYKEKWLEDFFKILSDNTEWINCTTFTEYTEQNPSSGIVYLNNASYSEMMEWALPANIQNELSGFKKEFKHRGLEEQYNKYMGKGYFRNFLYKYPESNYMHKKMLYVSKKVHDMKKSDAKDKALDHLWAGQCNCPYWHGVFGGLYLPHLRHAIYENLIKAEKIADENYYKKNNMNVVVEDIDYDGNDELLLSNKYQNLYFKTSKGAGIFEDDIKDIDYNLLNCLSRKDEFYHKKIRDLSAQGKISYDPTDTEDKVVFKEEGLHNLLNYDWHERHSLKDHFFHPETDLYKYMKVDYGEQGDFVNTPFEYRIIEKGSDYEVEFTRDGGVWVENEFVKIKLKKHIRMDSEKTTFNYEITNNSNRKVDLWHGVDFVLSMLGGHADDRYYKIKDEKAGYADNINEISECKKISMIDEYNKKEYEYTIDKYTNIWTFPIETVSLSEAGFEKNYQSSIIVFNQKFSLNSGESYKFSITRDVKKI